MYVWGSIIIKWNLKEKRIRMSQNFTLHYFKEYCKLVFPFQSGLILPQPVYHIVLLWVDLAVSNLDIICTRTNFTLLVYYCTSLLYLDFANGGLWGSWGFEDLLCWYDRRVVGMVGNKDIW